MVGGVGCLGGFGLCCGGVCGGSCSNKLLHGACAILFPVVHGRDTGRDRLADDIKGGVSVDVERISTVI